MRTIGILGGMGPQATVELHDRLVRMASVGAAGPLGWCPRILVHSVPCPNFLEDPPGEVEAYLVREARTLVAAGADVVAMPCNTAHAHLPAIRGALPAEVEVLDMIALAAEAVRRGGHVRVGLLCTTLAEPLYREAMAPGIELLTLAAPEQKRLDRAIMHVMRGNNDDRDSQELRALTATLVDRGADCLVLGCTELPLIAPVELPVPVICPSTELAKACLGWAVGHNAAKTQRAQR